MTPLIAAAVLLAAVTHASWNAIAHGIKDQLLAFTLVGAGGTLCGALLAAFAPVPAAAAWPYLLTSVAVHIAYMTLLMASFRLGDFSQMYPIARGTAPVVVTILAAVFAGERPDAWRTAGVLVSSAGLAAIALASGGRLRGRGAALAAALGTGLAIATYTVIDGLGVRASGNSIGYTAWLLLLQGIPIPAYAWLTRRRQLLARLRPIAARGLLGGTLSVFAYGLVLWAQTRGDLAPISALRESSIIVGALIGTVFFKERFGRPRLVAAAMMVAGIGLMLHPA